MLWLAHELLHEENLHPVVSGLHSIPESHEGEAQEEAQCAPKLCHQSRTAKTRKPANKVCRNFW